MKKALCLLLCLALCAALFGCAPAYSRFTVTYYDLFDTAVTLLGYAKDQADFEKAAQLVYDQMLRDHRLFDAYNPYPGLNNLYTLNLQAGQAPVSVDDALYNLIAWSKEQNARIGGAVNIALGSVLFLWHDYRQSGTELPPMAQLREAAKHCDLADVVLDDEKKTVYFADPLLRLDLGAVAKGYAVERAAEVLAQSSMPSFLISAGGNVRTGNAPLDGRKSWAVSVQNPRGEEGAWLDILSVNNLSAVTSGDYQRYYELDGVRYHHLISPETLMPADFMQSVTVVTEDSTLGDFLSSTLFLMPYEEGLALVSSLPGVEALWVLASGQRKDSPGLAAYLRSGK